ncbi:hypothetical protein [Acetobacter thailandicus]|uniref:Uncharacterized protein n=1 Tax=Acetobacter thailandicus TaxID=1502842 RepID=A0ABT3QCK4_9PROT|nr:hypothetical protein [Acetobacter thailandicus]MCX2563022.1 hypothetical protein [Acetobacter thailandicus]
MSERWWGEENRFIDNFQAIEETSKIVCPDQLSLQGAGSAQWLPTEYLARGNSSSVDPLKGENLMALHRTSRLSVRASPAELERWNYIAHQHGHATTAHWT